MAGAAAGAAAAPAAEAAIEGMAVGAAGVSDGMSRRGLVLRGASSIGCGSSSLVPAPAECCGAEVVFGQPGMAGARVGWSAASSAEMIRREKLRGLRPGRQFALHRAADRGGGSRKPCGLGVRGRGSWDSTLFLLLVDESRCWYSGQETQNC